MANTTFYNPDLVEADPKFGHIAGYPVGSSFKSRKDCSAAGVHAPNYAGIAGNRTYGAYSICMSGGYEDDQDKGETFIYTGTGDHQSRFIGVGNHQVEDQSFEHKDNYALKKSSETGRPVRVIRGRNAKSNYAPLEGYRYDGLYRVEKAYLAKGKSGYIVCKYELRRVPGQPPLKVKSSYNYSFGSPST
ncbi:SRA-YDG [Phlegmacium glaucopus]|nr:SRA-YDG [Phlegmacium glaucopus]